MRLMFVYWAFEDQGSGLVIQGYTEAARMLGHEVAVYGRWIPGKVNPRIPLNYSLDLASADAVVFIFEWTTQLKPGDRLDLVRERPFGVPAPVVRLPDGVQQPRYRPLAAHPPLSPCARVARHQESADRLWRPLRSPRSNRRST